MIDDFRGRWAFLSNFYPAPLIWQGIKFPTAEHALHAGKTNDRGLRNAIAIASTPRLAKKMGRRLIDLPDTWDTFTRYRVMAEVLRAKFTAHPGRVQALLSTGSAVLVEGNYWHDQHWGDCRCGRPACRTPGGNHLGWGLMALRELLEGERQC